MRPERMKPCGSLLILLSNRFWRCVSLLVAAGRNVACRYPDCATLHPWPISRSLVLVERQRVLMSFRIPSSYTHTECITAQRLLYGGQSNTQSLSVSQEGSLRMLLCFEFFRRSVRQKCLFGPLYVQYSNACIKIEIQARGTALSMPRLPPTVTKHRCVSNSHSHEIG